MEKYIVNGHEIEYDTFDLANMELYDSEVRRIEEEVKSLDPQSVAGDDYLRVLRGQAESILDFFDTLLGEGTAKAVFGGKVNVRDIFAAYRSFTQDVPKMLRDGFSGAAPSAALPVNPQIDSISSVRPAPARPANPRISPLFTWKLIFSRKPSS